MIENAWVRWYMTRCSDTAEVCSESIEASEVLIPLATSVVGASMAVRNAVRMVRSFRVRLGEQKEDLCAKQSAKYAFLEPKVCFWSEYRKCVGG